MKNTRVALLIVVVVFSVCFGAGSEEAQIAPSGMVIQVVTISKQDAATIFRRVEAVLEKETKAPVRWPSFIPTETGDKHPLYVNLLSEDRDSYNMELGWTPDCIGGGYCHYGSVRASAMPLIQEGRAQTAVKLLGGIAGYFMDSSTCGTRCDDATIGWSEGGYHYSISVKAEKKEILIKVADSAIASGKPEAALDSDKPKV